MPLYVLPRPQSRGVNDRAQIAGRADDGGNGGVDHDGTTPPISGRLSRQARRLCVASGQRVARWKGVSGGESNRAVVRAGRSSRVGGRRAWPAVGRAGGRDRLIAAVTEPSANLGDTTSDTTSEKAADQRQRLPKDEKGRKPQVADPVALCSLCDVTLEVTSRGRQESLSLRQL